MEDLTMTDLVFYSGDEKPKGEVKPINHWDGPWIEKTDEFGEKIMVPAVNFSEKDIDVLDALMFWHWKTNLKRKRIPRKLKKELKKKHNII